MIINNVSQRGFGATFATLGETKFTDKQKKLISGLNSFIISDTPTGDQFDVIPPNVVIFAKAEGKDKISLSTAVHSYVDGKYYEVPNGRNCNKRAVTREKSLIKSFKELVDKLFDLHTNNELFLEYDFETGDLFTDTKKLKQQPKNIKIQVPSFDVDI